MISEIFLPAAVSTRATDAGPPAEESIITDWLAFSGDHVHKGQVLGHAEIGGVATDIAAPATGVLHILAPVDRPVLGLDLAAVIDTAPDARSFTVTLAPASPEWTADLPPATPWTADRPSAHSPAKSPSLVALAPTAVSDERHPPPRPDAHDAPRPLATRLPLLSRHVAALATTPEPVVTPLVAHALAEESPATVPPRAAPNDAPRTEVSERAALQAATTAAPPISTPRERLYASPRARALARLMGVDVISVKGSGPFGRVEEEDVRQYLRAGGQASVAATRPSGSEQASPVEADTAIIIETTAVIIADRLESPAPCASPAQPMELRDALCPPPPCPVALTETDVTAPAPARGDPEATDTIPPEPRPLPSPTLRESDAGQNPPAWQPAATITVQVDATNLILMQERLTTGIQQKTGEPLAYDVMLAKLVALALRDHQALNARQTSRGIEIMPGFDLGLTADTLPGQAVCVLADAGSKDLLTLSREAALQARGAAPDGGIPANVQPATFTIITLGEQGVDICMPAVPHPQCAALGLGCLAPRPVVLEGRIVVRATVFVSLSYVITCISAGQAAGFLRRLAALVEDPVPLAEGLIY
jgi:pyruvate dehydrogenase E2 component (dihydrolipoamide acetyltransferase)